MEETSGAHLAAYPRHRGAEADVIEACDNEEALGKGGWSQRSSLTHLDSDIVLTDVITDWASK